VADGWSQAGFRGAAGARARINWEMVLEQLPKRFKASQVRTVRGLKNKPAPFFSRKASQAKLTGSFVQYAKKPPPTI
jgi:hypothetical protein